MSLKIQVENIEKLITVYVGELSLKNYTKDDISKKLYEIENVIKEYINSNSEKKLILG